MINVVVAVGAYMHYCIEYIRVTIYWGRVQISVQQMCDSV